MTWKRGSVLVLGVFLATGAARGQAGPWIKTSIPGFKVYSDLSEAETRARLAGILVAIDDFERLWPTPGVENGDPGKIVFCQNLIAARRLNSRFPVLPFLIQDRVNVFINTRCSHGINTPISYPAPPWVDVWGDHLLQRTYSAAFDRVLGERKMPWLSQGIGKLIQGMVCEGDAIALPALETDATLRARLSSPDGASLQAALRQGKFLTLHDLFTVLKPPSLQWPLQRYYIHNGKPPDHAFTYYYDGHVLAGPGNQGFGPALPYGPFIDEAYEFAEFGLFADKGKYRKAFIRFAVAAANGPVDEAAFREHFGTDEASMLREIWKFTAFAEPRSYPLPPRENRRLLSAANLVFTPVSVSEFVPVATVWLKARWQPSNSDAGGDGYNHDLAYNFHSLY